MSSNFLTGKQQVQTYFSQGNYTQAALLCEQALDSDSHDVSYHWYLGLARLLQGEEAEAQLIWMTPMLEATSEEASQWQLDLQKVLVEEANRRVELSDYQTAWLIRQHLREIVPDDVENLLWIVRLSAQLNILEVGNPSVVRVSELLKDRDSSQVESELIQDTLEQVLSLSFDDPSILDFAKSCAVCEGGSAEILQLFLDRAVKYKRSGKFDLAISWVKLGLEFDPDNVRFLSYMADCLQDAERAIESLAWGERCLELSNNLVDRLSALHIILKGIMQSGGQSRRAIEVYSDYKQTIEALSQENTALSFSDTLKIMSMGSLCPYIEDSSQDNRRLRNQIAQRIESSLRAYYPDELKKYYKPVKSNSKVLKIGYLSECLREHSIGWLVRWLLQYHDRNCFEIHAYSSRKMNDRLQSRFQKHYVQYFHEVTYSISQAADRIYDDGIDILVDLDSLTSNHGCGVMSLKPAPIQVTWLGFDASGIPSIDYFLADPYVLPDSAQDYYSETIWRLPQTYLAVDGFEVGVPTLRRDRLDIPNDAIVYFSSQTGYKHNVNGVRLQMQILKDVKNSYLLIKSLNSEENCLQDLFHKVAEEEGVSFDRLRFLPPVFTSETHRANLGIADVVLDTYPYNGTTTTLETLWMGIPVVTRVGEQFASRQGYTLLMNAGITEGIAWSDEEYVEWGVRLGSEPKLRQKIFSKLQAAKQISPLWNTKQFAREVEIAYEQMWKRDRDMKG
jgi:predicted O-linked N-acetylglucosamine transferase (SPINDLY family)